MDTEGNTEPTPLKTALEIAEEKLEKLSAESKEEVPVAKSVSEEGEKPSGVKTGQAIWKNKEGDQPVIVTGSLGMDNDGKEYVSIEGSATGIPIDQIEFPKDEAVKEADYAESPPQVGESTEEIKNSPLFHQKFGKALNEARARGEVLDAANREKIMLEVLASYQQGEIPVAEEASEDRSWEEGKQEREELVRSLNEDLDSKISGTKDKNEQIIFNLLKERWQISENAEENIKEDFLTLKEGGPTALITEWFENMKDPEGSRIYADDQITELLKDKSDKGLCKKIEYGAIPQLLTRRMMQPDFDPEEFTPIDNASWTEELKEVLAHAVEEGSEADEGAVENSAEYQDAKEAVRNANKEGSLSEEEISWTALAKLAGKKLGIRKTGGGIIKLPAKTVGWIKKNPDKTIKRVTIASTILFAPFIISVPVAGYYIYKVAKGK